MLGRFLMIRSRFLFCSTILVRSYVANLLSKVKILAESSLVDRAIRSLIEYSIIILLYSELCLEWSD